MKRILIIQTASIGDVILATAMVESLHLSFPEAFLDLMVKKGNESLFDGHPFVRQILTWDKQVAKYSNLFRILRLVRSNKYDLVINLQRFVSTGLVTAFSGSRESRGFSKNPVSFLFKKRYPHPIAGNVHEVTRNHSLISDLGDTSAVLPRLYPTGADVEAIAPYTTRKFYTISPASLWFTKQYPTIRWIDLIRRIHPDTAIFLLGGPVDIKLCEEIVKKSGHPRIGILAGKLTFLQSAALMKSAAMNFTNDSAPMHLASAVNAPITAIYCSTIPAFGFGPLSTDSAIAEISTALPCRPCGLHGYKACPEKHFRCANEIDTELLACRLL